VPLLVPPLEPLVLVPPLELLAVPPPMLPTDALPELPLDPVSPDTGAPLLVLVPPPEPLAVPTWFPVDGPPVLLPELLQFTSAPTIPTPRSPQLEFERVTLRRTMLDSSNRGAR
jgi:hypothetical protein